MSKLRFALFIGLTLAMSASAFADTMFYLTVPEHGCTTGNCAPADTVLVDVDLLTSTTATITFTAAGTNGVPKVGGNAYSIYALEFDVNATNFGISQYVVSGSSTSGNNGTFKPVTVTAGSLDSYGTFNEASGVGGTNSVEVFHDATEVVFSLTDLSGTWASSANVLGTATGTNPGNYPGESFNAAGQVRVTSCSSGQPGCSGVDNGHIGNTLDTAGTVPEPTSVVLLLSLVSFVGLGYRSKRTA